MGIRTAGRRRAKVMAKPERTGRFRSADQLKAEGKTSKDISEAILGLRGAQEEEARGEGRPEDAQKLHNYRQTQTTDSWLPVTFCQKWS
jgi:hypothetical protein